MRRRVAELCDTHGELAFTSVFFGESLPTDLRDARSQTTVKLDAPRNKIEALLGVPSVNRMLHHPFQRSLHDIIAARDVLVVRGASGSIGEGNAIKVLTWLLRCLDAALSDQQQKPAAERVRVALEGRRGPPAAHPDVRADARRAPLRRPRGDVRLAAALADQGPRRPPGHDATCCRTASCSA